MHIREKQAQCGPLHGMYEEGLSEKYRRRLALVLDSALSISERISNVKSMGVFRLSGYRNGELLSEQSIDWYIQESTKKNPNLIEAAVMLDLLKNEGFRKCAHYDLVVVNRPLDIKSFDVVSPRYSALVSVADMPKVAEFEKRLRNCLEELVSIEPFSVTRAKTVSFLRADQRKR